MLTKQTGKFQYGRHFYASFHDMLWPYQLQLRGSVSFQ